MKNAQDPATYSDHNPCYRLAGRAWRGWHLGALLAHVLLTVLFTWPLLASIFAGDATPGLLLEDRDQNLWNLWWVREAVLSGQNPFVTDYIWHPDGVSLYFHTLNFFNGLVAIPLLSVFSLATTYNLVVFFSFAVSGWGAFLLVHHLTGSRWGALVGSAVFAYSAYHIATMRGILQLISLEWVPFFALFLIAAVFAPRWGSRAEFGRWTLARLLPASFALLLVSLVDWYYTMHMLLLVGLLGVFVLVRFLWQARSGSREGAGRELAEPALRIGLVLGLYAVLVSPLLLPTVAELRSNSYMRPSPQEAVANSADLLAFFQPSRDNRLLGGLSSNRNVWPFASNQYEVYLTYTGLLLAGAGAIFGRRTLRAAAQGVAGRYPGPRFWAASGLVFFALALGPVLQVNGQQVRSVAGIDLTMPYRVVEGAPLLNISRSPDRFAMPLSLCFAVLAGYGVRALGGVGRGEAEARQRIVAVGAVALFALEVVPVPYPQSPVAVPRWYQALGQEAGDFTILELPAQDEYWHGSFRMHGQTAHGKSIFGGYISREFSHPFLESTPGYAYLTGASEGDLYAAGRPEWLSALALYDTRYVVLQKDRLPGVNEEQVDVSSWREAIGKVLGPGAPVYEDEQLAAYRVPPAAERVPIVSVGAGWGPAEQGTSGWFRWMTAPVATLLIDSPSPRSAEVAFKATTVGPGRTLVVEHGGIVVFEADVGALAEERTAVLDVPAGRSVLRLSSPGGLVVPSELGLSDDPRSLGFALVDVRLVEPGAERKVEPQEAGGR